MRSVVSQETIFDDLNLQLNGRRHPYRSSNSFHYYYKSVRKKVSSQTLAVTWQWELATSERRYANEWTVEQNAPIVTHDDVRAYLTVHNLRRQSLRQSCLGRYNPGARWSSVGDYESPSGSILDSALGSCTSARCPWTLRTQVRRSRTNNRHANSEHLVSIRVSYASLGAND